MNIGLFSDTYYPQVNGVATSVLLLKENLEKLGHSVSVFTTTDPDAFENEHNVYRLPSMPFTSARRIGLLYHPGIAKRIKTMELDIIHTHTEFSLGIFGRTLANELEIPTVHTMHTMYEQYTHYIAKNTPFDPAVKNLARKLCRHYCNRADVVIAPTGKVRDTLLGYGVDNRIEIIPTGIDLDKFASTSYEVSDISTLKASYGFTAEDRILLYIGRISQEKNISEILYGLADYLPQHPEVKFLVVGNGPDIDNLKGLARSLGIGRQVIFAGEKPWDCIGLYYQLGDVFVSASQSETQGLTYIEALAAGLPLIVKMDSCLEKVLQEGINGFSFTNKTGFLAALDGILSSKAVLQGMSDAAAHSAESFSVSGFARKVAALYEEVVSRTV